MCVLLQVDNNGGGAGKGDFGPACRKGSTVQGSLVLPGCNGMSKSSHRLRDTMYIKLVHV